jgi:hypothetical protein
MPSKKKKPEHLLPSANEPMVDYLSSKRYKDSFKTITISSFEEQEEDMRRYWASITPLHRLHDLNILVKMAFGLTPEKLKNPRLSKKINLIPYEEYFS